MLRTCLLDINLAAVWSVWWVLPPSPFHIFSPDNLVSRLPLPPSTKNLSICFAEGGAEQVGFIVMGLVFFFFVFYFGVCGAVPGILLHPANHKFTCSEGWTPWLVFNSNPIAQIFFFFWRTFCFLISFILVEACIANLCLCCAYAPSVLRGLSAFFKLKTKKGRQCR